MSAADRLLGLARAWFDEPTVARYFEPLVADGARECHDARGTARVRALVRMHACFATTFALGYGRQLTRPLPVGLSISAWFQIELFAIAGTAVAFAPFYPMWRSALPAYLLPAALTLALPFAVLPVAVLLASNSQVTPWQARSAMARVTLVALLAMVALTGWIAPWANQSYRNDFLSRRDGRPTIAARGVRELTIAELVSGAQPTIGDPTTRRLTIAQRTSMTLLPISLAVLGISLGRYASRRRWAIAIASWVLAAFAVFLIDAATVVVPPLVAMTLVHLSALAAAAVARAGRLAA